MSKIIFEFHDRNIKIIVDKIGNYVNDWNAIREARDRLEAQGITMGSFHGKVTYISEL